MSGQWFARKTRHTARQRNIGSEYAIFHQACPLPFTGDQQF
jgi:hypothetical protein